MNKQQLKRELIKLRQRITGEDRRIIRRALKYIELLEGIIKDFEK